MRVREPDCRKPAGFPSFGELMPDVSEIEAETWLQLPPTSKQRYTLSIAMPWEPPETSKPTDGIQTIMQCTTRRTRHGPKCRRGRVKCVQSGC